MPRNTRPAKVKLWIEVLLKFRKRLSSLPFGWPNWAMQIVGVIINTLLVVLFALLILSSQFDLLGLIPDELL